MDMQNAWSLSGYLMELGQLFLDGGYKPIHDGLQQPAEDSSPIPSGKSDGFAARRRARGARVAPPLRAGRACAAGRGRGTAAARIRPAFRRCRADARQL